MINRTVLVVLGLVILIVVVYHVLADPREVNETSKLIFNGELKIDELPQIDVDDGLYRSYNPSIATVDGKTLLVQRLSNYTGCMNEKPKIQGSNVESFITLLYNNEVMHVQTDVVASSNCPQGYEDARPMLSPDGKTLLLFCAARGELDCLQSMWILFVATSDLQGSKFDMSRQVTRTIKPHRTLRLTTPISTHRHEKNWMPLILNDQVHLIYSINPHIILNCDMKSGVCEVVAKTYNPELSDNLRGGSQVVFLPSQRSTKDMYVAAVHERRGFNSYLTRFYGFSPDWPHAVSHISDEFVFDDGEDEALSSIQFASGLHLSKDRKGRLEVNVAYGEHDCHSKLCTIGGDRFLESLQSVNQANLIVTPRMK